MKVEAWVWEVLDGVGGLLSQGLIKPKLTSSLLCSQCWLLTPDSPAFTSSARIISVIHYVQLLKVLVVAKRKKKAVLR